MVHHADPADPKSIQRARDSWDAMVEVVERMGHDGEVLVPLDEADVLRKLRDLDPQQRGVAGGAEASGTRQ